MRINALILWVAVIVTACNTHSEYTVHEGESFKSEQQNGKWTTDQATAEELKGMKNTIENFTLLNKKKFENLKAYQEFGDLMTMHIERVTQYCRLDADTRNLLCRKLETIKPEIEILHGNDMQKSKEALTRINSTIAEIDSTFNYSH